MLAEQLEIIDRLWTDDRVTFHGEHYRLNAPDDRCPSSRPTRRSSSAVAAPRSPQSVADEYNDQYVPRSSPRSATGEASEGDETRPGDDAFLDRDPSSSGTRATKGWIARTRSTP